MKIIGIGLNYKEHVKEFGGQIPTSPVVFLKPDTSLLKDNSPFYIPEFTNEVHYETEVIIRICKEGKHISEKFAPKYFDKIGIGIDFTARDLQSTLKEKGQPWALAKGFNGAAPISTWWNKEDFDIDNLNFSLKLNENIVQDGNTSDMIFNYNQLISYVSSFMTLKTGDIIFTGTPSGVGPVKIGDQLTAYIDNQKALDFEVK